MENILSQAEIPQTTLKDKELNDFYNMLNNSGNKTINNLLIELKNCDSINPKKKKFNHISETQLVEIVKKN